MNLYINCYFTMITLKHGISKLTRTNSLKHRYNLILCSSIIETHLCPIISIRPQTSGQKSVILCSLQNFNPRPCTLTPGRKMMYSYFLISKIVVNRKLVRVQYGATVCTHARARARARTHTHARTQRERERDRERETERERHRQTEPKV